MLHYELISSEDYKLVLEQIKESFKIPHFEQIIKQYSIIVAEGRWKEVFLVSEEVLKLFLEIKKQRNPYCLGLHFGDISKNKFKISLEGLTFISKYLDVKTRLADSGEKKVIYGRNLAKRDVNNIVATVKKGDLLMLINHNKEVLGLGKCLYDRESIRRASQGDDIIQNIMDKGWYLRKGK